MVDKLENKLKSIEKALGGEENTPNVEDKLGWHLDYIEDLIQEGGSGGIEDVKVNDTAVVEDNIANIKLKTINDNIISGEGNITIESGTQVVANPTLAGDESDLTGLEIGSNKYKVSDSIGYLTTAPSVANTSGRLIFVVLSAEPTTYYDGYYYIITESQSVGE